MKEKPENDPAFPNAYGNFGMTIRDYFAAAALQCMTAGITLMDNPASDEYTVRKINVSAKFAYFMADAMLEARVNHIAHVRNMVDDDKLVEAVIKAIMDVLERPDNWGVTPYAIIAREAIAAVRAYDGAQQSVMRQSLAAIAGYADSLLSNGDLTKNEREVVKIIQRFAEDHLSRNEGA